MLLHKNLGRNFWYLGAKEGNIETLQKPFEWAEGNLTAQEMSNEFLLDKDRFGMTAWHLSAYSGKLEVFRTILDWAERT